MDLFTHTFVQHAFLAGTSAALLAGLLGPFVVSSRQSVASDMLAHIALVGVGIAAVFNFLPLAGAFAVLVIGAILLWWIITKEIYATDALAMVFLSGGLAIALALVHIARNQAISFESYLFGSILTVTSGELIIMGLLTAVVALCVNTFWFPLLGVVQVPAYRVPYSKKPEYMQLLFFVLLALAVWVGIKTVGGLLIGALLVIPTMVARTYVQSFKSLTALSVSIGLIGVYTGLAASLFVDIPVSSAIILALLCILILSALWQQVWGRQ